MKKLMIFMTVSGFLLLLSISMQARTISPETYYNYAIAKKISKCIQIAAMANSKSECIGRCAKMRDLQAKFYTQNREELVQEMVAQEVGMRPHEVEYFLIKAFFDAYPKLASQAIR